MKIDLTQRDYNGRTRHDDTYVLNIPLFLLICLKYIQELLVGVVIVHVARLDLVEVLNGMIEFARCLLSDGVPAIEVSEKGGGCGSLRAGESRGVERRTGVKMQRVRGHGAGECATAHGCAVAERHSTIGIIDALGGCAGRGSDGDCVWIKRVGGNINSVADGEKSVKTLDKIGVAMKKTRNALYDSRRVDTTTR